MQKHIVQKDERSSRLIPLTGHCLDALVKGRDYMSRVLQGADQSEASRAF
jgi:hypothetical protein